MRLKIHQSKKKQYKLVIQLLLYNAMKELYRNTLNELNQNALNGLLDNFIQLNCQSASLSGAFLKLFLSFYLKPLTHKHRNTFSLEYKAIFSIKKLVAMGKIYKNFLKNYIEEVLSSIAMNIL